MRKLYLHIGTYKTGSSALQMYFTNNREALLERDIDYLLIGPNTNSKKKNVSVGNGQPLAMSFWPKNAMFSRADKHTKFMAQLDKALGNTKAISPLISGESFCDMTPDQMISFKKHLNDKGFEPHIILFIRDQASYLESRYNQFVKKRAMTESFRDFYQSFQEETPHLHYATYVDQLCDIWNKNNVNVFAYGDQNIFDSINELLSLDAKVMTIPKRQINVSLPPEQMVILRELNQLSPRTSLSTKLVQNEAKLLKDKDRKKISILTSEIRADIASYFEQENSSLARSWFNRERLFEETELNWTSEDTLANSIQSDTVIDMIGGLIVKNEDRLHRIETTIKKMQK